MQNILLILIEAFICYASIVILNKKYKEDGLYIYGIIAMFTSCIMSLKQVDFLGITVPIGFAVSTSLIIVGNLITQKKGPDSIKTYITLILITGLIGCCFLNMSGLIEISDYSRLANLSYNSIFEYNLRIYIANILSIVISIYIGSKLYYLIKRTNNKIIINNTFTMIIIELLDNAIFMLIGYAFTYDFAAITLAIIIRYIIKTIIGILGTIPIYILNKNN